MTQRGSSHFQVRVNYFPCLLINSLRIPFICKCVIPPKTFQNYWSYGRISRIPPQTVSRIQTFSFWGKSSEPGKKRINISPLSACSNFLFSGSVPLWCLVSSLYLSLSCREHPSCSSAPSNKPERDSLADSCSRWHHHSMVSHSSGSGSRATTSKGGCPLYAPAAGATHQHQHGHMAGLRNAVRAALRCSRRSPNEISLLFLSIFCLFVLCGFDKLCVWGLVLFLLLLSCRIVLACRNALQMNWLLSWRQRWENSNGLISLCTKTARRHALARHKIG